MRPLGKTSVRQAVLDLYPTLPRKFSMISLHCMVAHEIKRPYVFMDTIRRKAMELREEGIIHFENIDKKRALYQKTDRL
jgi:uncharacterized protein (DUF302 family)